MIGVILGAFIWTWVMLVAILLKLDEIHETLRDDGGDDE